VFIFLHTHPIQYFVPLYQYLTAQGLPLEVWYCDEAAGRGGYDAEFGQQVSWDLPLLEGYRYRFFANEGGRGARNFWYYYNPGMLGALKEMPPAWVVVHAWNYLTCVMLLRKAHLYGHRLAFRGETNLAMEMARPAWQRLLRKWMLRYPLRQVDRFLYIGNQSRDFYSYLGIADSKLVFTPYAVDNARFASAAGAQSRPEARQKLGLPQDAFVVLSTAKYIAKKRPLDLIEAFARAKLPNAVLLMVGEGNLRGQMESAIAQYNLEDRVQLTGFVNQGAIATYYRAADCFVLCSDFGETWGLSANEAMNFGLPLLLSDRCGCAADLAEDGVNGYVFPAGDIARLAGRLAQLEAMGTAGRLRMGQASLQKIEGYSVEMVYRGLMQLWTG
jgi:glycosyltransferase involved in cell wall biosynthesis